MDVSVLKLLLCLMTRQTDDCNSTTTAQAVLKKPTTTIKKIEACDQVFKEIKRMRKISMLRNTSIAQNRGCPYESTMIVDEFNDTHLRDSDDTQDY